jgi:transposase
MKHQFTGQMIRGHLQGAKTKREFQRVQCIWLKLAFAMNSVEIAHAIGWSPASVRRIQAQVSREGIQSLSDKQWGGRRREYMSLSREKQILSKFERQARRGRALNLKHIKKAYEISAGKAVAISTIYRLIARHGLRRFLPTGRSFRSD